MSFYYAPVEENESVVKAALRVITATHYARESDPHADADHEYSQEQLALAARALVEAVDKLPEDKQPIGWVRQPCPAALLPTGSDLPEPCVIQGNHHTHQTEDGRTWANSEVNVEATV